MNKKNEIGIIGMGVMGANLAQNFLSKGVSIAVYDIDFSKYESLPEQILRTTNLQEFVDSLDFPRKIILLLPSGKIIDQTIENLIPLLQKQDILIDAGNSFYQDTEKRSEKLSKVDLNFIGMGISGGKEGALNGPSLMPSCNSKVWIEIEKYLKKIAAKDFNNQPCISNFAAGVNAAGAGHFVKTVHNGIEYAIMQVLAEIYGLMRENQTNLEISAQFKSLKNTIVSGFLTEILVDILEKQADEGFLLDKILDQAGQKGTGFWTSQTALEYAVNISTINEAVNARIVSSQRDLRIKLAENLNKKEIQSNEKLNLEGILITSMILIYAQAFDLIKTVSDQKKWSLNLSEIVRIWQGGCIIRSNILKIFEEILKTNSEQTFLLNSQIIDLLNNNQNNLRDFVKNAVSNSIAAPVSSAAIAYFDGMKTSQSNANLIQAMRDVFGSHGFQRIDQEGIAHFE